MNNPYYVYPYYPNYYYGNEPMHNYRQMPVSGYYWGCGVPNQVYNESQFWGEVNTRDDSYPLSSDHGGSPFVTNINQATRQNNNFRTAIWTGDYLQVTLMNVNVGDDVGLEVHHDVDQFLRIEEGHGLVQMGKDKNRLDFVRYADKNSAIMVPAGYWHNLTNRGNIPLKLYSIYAPPEHPFGTVHKTKADDIAAEG